MKKFSLGKILLLTVLVLFLLVAFTKNTILRLAITSTASNLLGAKVEMKAFSWGVLNQTVNIKGFKIQNPPGFTQDDPLVDMPELTVKYNLPELLLKRKIHIPLFKLNIKQMTVVKNKDGILNTDALKVTKKMTSENKQQTQPDADNSSKKTADKIEMQIDELNLSLRKVLYMDFAQSNDGIPALTFHDLGIQNQISKNITSAEQLVTVVLMQGLKGAAVKGAALYGAQALLGVGFAPLAVASVLTSKDFASDEIPLSFGKLYDKTLASLKKTGEVSSENKTTGEIKGKYEGSDITITISSTGGQQAEIKVSARKLMIPQPNTAEKFIYYLKK